MKKVKGSILIVEDNPHELFLIQTGLEQLGVQETICAVQSSDEAVAFLSGKGPYADRQKFPFPTFLLTDLRMPKVNGLELLLFVKRSKFIIVPTIIFTMSSEPEDIKNAYLFGANAYHVKPQKMEEYYGSLKRIVEYWTTVESPRTDDSGNLLPTDGKGSSIQPAHPIVVDLSKIAGAEPEHE